MGSSLLKALEQVATAQATSVNAIVNKVMAQAVESGQAGKVARSVRDAMLAETEIEDWYVAGAQVSRREDVMGKWREGQISKGSALKQLRRLERVARNQRDLSRGNKEEWENQRVRVMVAVKEVYAQQELAVEKPARRRSPPKIETAPIDTEDYDPATHGPPIEPPEDDTPEPPGGWRGE